MTEERWKTNLIELGRLGRQGGRRAEKYEDLDESMGLSRTQGSSAMVEAHRYLIEEMKAAGLEVCYDRVGNLFGRRAGRGDKKAVLSGSHADTVVNGGQFDGIYGVVAALEALRRLSQADFDNLRPLEMVVFMGEEGSFFEKALLGSDVLCGRIKAEEALAEKGSDGRSLAQVLKAYPPEEIQDKDLAEYDYFIETHIEQGPVLFQSGRNIGSVHSLAGLYHLRLEFEGQENHAGSTPMGLRRDPLPVAAEVIQFVRKLALGLAGRNGTAVATVDTISLEPNSPSVIPGRVILTIDIRDAREKDMRGMRDSIKEFSREQGRKHKVGVKSSMLIEHPPCPLDPEVKTVIENAAQRNGYSCQSLFSGAVHDTLNMAGRVKSGLIFVPSREGLSHSPYEWTDWQELEAGISVLTDTLKSLSQT